MVAKTDPDYRTVNSGDEDQTESVCGNGDHRSDRAHSLVFLFVFLGFCLISLFARDAAAVAPITPPILISEATSTRAIAVESLTLTREPFALLSPHLATAERTRVMIFAMDLTLQPGDDLSVISADAEDASHRHYALSVESIRSVPSYEWIGAVVFKLNDELIDVGDVLVSVSYRSVLSNRVRIGIGHVGGGLADDPGAHPTPAVPYTISGQLTGGGQGVSGISVTLNGLQSGTVVTDANGFYTFIVPKVGEYTLTAASNLYYNFVPQTFTNVNRTHIVNFTGGLRNYTVSGRLTLGSNPAAFVVVPIVSSQTTATTNANGEYSFSLPAGGNYGIAPSVTYYTFEPATQSVVNLTSDQTNRDFNGQRQTFTISGRVKGRDGNGIAGIFVHATGGPILGQLEAVSDQTGYYEFAGMQAGYDYTLTPPSTASHAFQPQSFVDLRSSQTFDFVGLRRLTLSGTVHNQSGNGIISITVTLSGSDSATAITGADGRYSFPATETGNYTITPSFLQDWYLFAPATAQFNNLDGTHTTDFNATIAPLPNPAYVLEFDGQQKTVDYGDFWPDSVNLGHFFWEFWARAGSNQTATYMLSDGYGGAHALLFGLASFNSSEPNRYEMSGNIYDGVKFDNFFGSDQGPANGEWAHMAVGWDGQNIITYYNGVPVGKAPFAGPRRTPGFVNGGGRLLIGGSDHSNFEGRIAQVRGYEGSNPREASPGGVESSFAPQTVFAPDGNLLSYYFRSGSVTIPDLSQGYNGVSHPGRARGTSAGILYDCGACPPPQFVIDPTAPDFAANTPPPVFIPPPPAAPGGALVFDSFSRANSTYLFGSQGGLGSTEGGSGGTKVWQTNQAAGNPQPFGILNAIAVLLGSDAAIAWVETGGVTGRLDIHVNRQRGRWGRGPDTGISFRVEDANNFFFAYTNTAGGASGSQLLKVGYYLDGQRTDLTTDAATPSTWTTLRVVTTDVGDLKVYADTTLVYSANSSVMATATGAGLYNNSSGLGLVNRWDNFTVFDVP